MSGTVWLKRGNGYSLSVSLGLSCNANAVHLVMYTPGGYQSFTVDRKLLMAFVEELNVTLYTEGKEG